MISVFGRYLFDDITVRTGWYNENGMYSLECYCIPSEICLDRFNDELSPYIIEDHMPESSEWVIGCGYMTEFDDFSDNSITEGGNTCEMVRSFLENALCDSESDRIRHIIISVELDQIFNIFDVVGNFKSLDDFDLFMQIKNL